MAEIYLFQGRPELSAAENLAGFIHSCRQYLTVFGENLDFDCPTWDITQYVERKGLENKRQQINYSTLQTAKNKSPEWMHVAFRPFAQAYMRYSYGFRPTLSYGHLLGTLRAAEAALNEHNDIPTPIKIDASVLNRAAQIAVEHYSARVAYRVGNYLEELATFMSENAMLDTPTVWRNPIRKPEDSIRIGPEFDKLRFEKMPSRAALEAIAKIYQLAVEPVDILITSIAALLLSSPDRINELLHLPFDCEIYEEQGKEKKEAYGLRWQTSKGAPPMIKWIVSSMATVVQDALKRIRAATHEAREIALWYEKNPESVYLPKCFEYLRNGRVMPVSELVRLFSLRNLAAGKDWCKARKIEVRYEKGERSIFFADFEKAILTMLPKRFPVFVRKSGLKYSEALMVVRVNELHSVRATNPCMFESISINQVNYNLGGRAQEHGRASIFTRFQFEEEDGSQIKVTSHQFRHYLNTMAQAGHMSQLDIAKWSGRRDIRQNEAYNHVSVAEKLEKYQKAIGADSLQQGEVAEIMIRTPVFRDKLELPFSANIALHITDLGICEHDFTMLPCSHFRDCIMCSELVCVKGMTRQDSFRKKMLQNVREMLARTEEAESQGIAGTKRWVAYYKAVLPRLEQLCAFVEDSTIPNGAVIRLAPPKAYRLTDNSKNALPGANA